MQEATPWVSERYLGGKRQILGRKEAAAQGTVI